MAGSRSATSGAVKAPNDCADDDHVIVVADGLDDHVGVVVQGRRLVVDGQVGRHRCA